MGTTIIRNVTKYTTAQLLESEVSGISEVWEELKLDHTESMMEYVMDIARKLYSTKLTMVKRIETVLMGVALEMDLSQDETEFYPGGLPLSVDELSKIKLPEGLDATFKLKLTIGFEPYAL